VRVRDVGILVWVGLLIIGVIGSMISSLRRQIQAQAEREQRSRSGRPPSAAQPARFRLEPAPKRLAPTEVPRAPSVPARPVPQPAELPSATHVTRVKHPIFAGRGELVRGVIAAEILGKPRGLSDEYFVR
jgi:hypothetical protein